MKAMHALNCNFFLFSRFILLNSPNKNYLCLSNSEIYKQMEQLKPIKELINQGDTEEAIRSLDKLIEKNPSCDEAYYLRGNAYRKQGNWQIALNSYLSAIEINPNSPALQAKDMLMNILNFYNKDMYNQ